MADVVIKHWSDIQRHLSEELERVGRMIETAETEREMWRAQGRAQALRALLNLPQTLTVLQGA